MALTVHFNIDTADQPLGSTGVNWLEFSEGNDQLYFSNGSVDVADGQPIPSAAEIISAGVILTGIQTVISQHFIADLSANLLEKIFNMGNQNKQYVVAFDFDAITASEPVLELYDDANLNTITSTVLGGGSPTSSFIKGVTTTYGTPGAGWALGSPVSMAGSSSNHFLYLNDQNGPLAAPQTLYCNLACVIPAIQTSGFSLNPVFVIKWLES